uniref:Uncharacterized protein n=1 Tax=Picea glauca TaxID=3330 RepID=A0A117NHJ1_PICGL|nr:hypothetical protein ABT39_MTgene4468 [Picea glauca]QHR91326.1 hypothetical protein Q903MT_gene5358 [Picea sitchensis]
MSIGSLLYCFYFLHLLTLLLLPSMPLLQKMLVAAVDQILN